MDILLKVALVVGAVATIPRLERKVNCKLSSVLTFVKVLWPKTGLIPFPLSYNNGGAMVEKLSKLH